MSVLLTSGLFRSVWSPDPSGAAPAGTAPTGTLAGDHTALPSSPSLPNRRCLVRPATREVPGQGRLSKLPDGRPGCRPGEQDRREARVPDSGRMLYIHWSTPAIRLPPVRPAPARPCWLVRHPGGGSLPRRGLREVVPPWVHHHLGTPPWVHHTLGTPHPGYTSSLPWATLPCVHHPAVLPCPGVPCPVYTRGSLREA